jgi:translation initiation factor 4A
VQTVIQALGDYLGVISHACVGGTSVSRDISALRSGAHVVVATPGRVFDMMSKSVLNTSCIRTIILDEADEMLSRGFIDIIRDIFKLLPADAQVGVFSATLPPEVSSITDQILHEPVRILVKKEELTLQGIRQFFVNVEKEEWKYATLCDLFETISVNQSIIFCNSKRKVDWLATKMLQEGFTVACIHGDKAEERRVVMQQFTSGAARVLITTDLLSRGIDVHHVSVVINFDLPRSLENYLHRIGRCGRFGRKGLAINFVTHHELELLRQLQQHYDTDIQEMPSNIADFV